MLKENKKKILILGAGCVGKAYGSILENSGNDIFYLIRSEYNKIKSTGFYQIQVGSQKEKIFTNKVYNDSKELAGQIFDIIIVSLKTTENHWLKDILPQLSDKNTIVVMLQNGLGNEEYISNFVSKECIVSAVTTIAATNSSEKILDISFIGELKLAPFCKEAETARNTIYHYLNSKKPFDANVVCYDNHREIRWKKIIWNAVFNPLSIIYQQSTDILSSLEPFITEVLSVMNEIKEMAKTEGVDISIDEINKMLENTRLNKGYFPSMYKDYQNNKPLETEFLIDTLIEFSKQHNLKHSNLNSIKKRLQQKLSTQHNYLQS